MALTPGIGQALADIVGRDHVWLDPNVTRRYACRPCALIQVVPDAVVFPGSTAEVSEVLRGAHACGVPVVERSATCNRSGGMVLLAGGIVLALDRMNRILDINGADGIARIQPGVCAERLHSAAAAAGVRDIPDWGCDRAGREAALDPHSRVLGLEAVLPSGEIVRTGGGLLAGEVDDRLFARLLTGPDGMLAVITEVTLALDPSRPFAYLGLAYFPTVAAACRAARSVMISDRMSARLEFLDRQRIRAVEDRAHLGLRLDARALLLFIGVDRSETCRDELRRICRTCEPSGALHITVAEDPLWCRALLDTVAQLDTSERFPDDTRSGSDIPATTGAAVTLAPTYSTTAADRCVPMLHHKTEEQGP